MQFLTKLIYGPYHYFFVRDAQLHSAEIMFGSSPGEPHLWLGGRVPPFIHALADALQSVALLCGRVRRRTAPYVSGVYREEKQAVILAVLAGSGVWRHVSEVDTAIILRLHCVASNTIHVVSYHCNHMHDSSLINNGMSLVGYWWQHDIQCWPLRE